MKKIYKYILRACLIAGMFIAGEGVIWGGADYYAKVTASASPTGKGTVYVSTASGSYSTNSATSDDGDDNYATFYIKAVNNSGYHFSQWSCTSSNSSDLTFSNKDIAETSLQAKKSSSSGESNAAAYTILASFDPNYTTQVTASADPSVGGTAYVKYGSSFSGTSTTADDGYGQTSTGVSETYSIKATQNAGYHFKGWSATNGSLSSSSSASTTINVTTQNGYTYAGSRYPCTVTANFEQNFYIRLTASSNNTSWGTVSATLSSTDNSETASQSRSYTLTATPTTNYHFVSWSKTKGDSNGSVSGNTFTGNTSSTAGAYNEYTVTGNFAENFYATLNTSVPNVGVSGSATGGGTKNVASSGGSCTFSLTAPTASSGYYFTGWTGTDITFSSASSLTTNATVNASTTGGSSNAATYIATANYSEHSRIITITASGTPATAGDQIIFNVTGPQTYRVSVPVGGSVTLKDVASGSYTITPQGWSWNYNVSPASATTNWDAQNKSTHTFNFTSKGSTKKYNESIVTIKP